MILRCDVTFFRSYFPHGLVVTSMTEFEFIRFCSDSPGENLVTQTDTKNRFTQSQRVADITRRDIIHFGITGPVRYYQAVKIDIKKIRGLGLTKWYPGWVYAARRDLDPVIVEQIKNAMLELNYEMPRDRKILAAADMTAIISSFDSDYTAVRDLFVNIWTGQHE